MQLLQVVGKTAVLVERIIRQVIEEKQDITRLLVVTFTKAAANEMRERVINAINEKLKENPENGHLIKQKKLMNKANLSTLHSFCVRTIKENFYKLNLKPNVKIGSEEDILVIRKNIINDLVDKLYEEDLEDLKNYIDDKELVSSLDFTELIKDFNFLSDNFCQNQSDEDLKDIISNLAYFHESIPFSNLWQSEVLSTYEDIIKGNIEFSDTEFAKILFKVIDMKIESSISKLNTGKTALEYLGEEYLGYIKVLEDDIAYLNEITNEKDLFIKKEHISNVSNLGKWPASRKLKCEETDYANELRKEVKKEIEKLDEVITINSIEDVVEDAIYHKKIIKTLFIIVNIFFSKFKSIKRERNIIDFADQEHLLLELLYDKEEFEEIENGKKVVKIRYVFSDIAKSIQSDFDEVQIDEYQDTSLVQEKILNAISNNNIFQVGDVKQSIYKFRNAKPELFLEKQEKYASSNLELRLIEEKENLKQDLSNKEQDQDNIESIKFRIKEIENELEKINIKKENGTLINLDKNFRSKENVLEFCNEIFKRIMRRDTGNIDYTIDEYLNLGSSKVDEETLEKIEILGIDTNLENIEVEEKINSLKLDINPDEFIQEMNELSDYEKEAKVIANKIKSIKEEYTNKGKNFNYSDVAILLRATKNTAQIFKTILNNEGIPAYCESDNNFFDIIHIDTLFCYLKVINNPLDDIALLGVLRSYFGNLDMQEITKIRINNIKDSYYESILSYIEIAKNTIEYQNGILNFETMNLITKLEEFLNTIESLKILEETSGLLEVLKYLIYQTGFYEYVYLDDNGEIYSKSLDILVKKVEEITLTSNMTLIQFIKYLNELKASGGSLGNIEEVLENEDLVKIMSIHKSKGLEFPIIFLANSFKSRNKMALNDNIMTDDKLGVAFNIVNTEENYEYSSIFKSAIKEKKRYDEIEEEMRVLYVALTRAKDKIIITGTKKEFDDVINKELDGIYNKEKSINKMDERSFVSASKILEFDTYMQYILLVLNQLNIEKNTVNIVDMILDNYYLENVKNIINKEELDKKGLLENTYISNIINYKEATENSKQNSEHNIEEYVYDDSLLDKTVDNKILNKLKQIDEIENSKIDIIPNKISVSNITSRIKQNYLQKEIEIGDFKKLELDIIIAKDNDSNKNNMDVKNTKNSDIQLAIDLPDFMKKNKTTGKEKGTLYHSIFEMLEILTKEEYYNIKNNEEKILKFITNFKENIINNEIYTKEELNVIQNSKLLNFINSSIYEKLVLSNEKNLVFKEKPFYTLITKADLESIYLENDKIQSDDMFNLNDDSNIMMQGIIDLYFILDNTLYIVDYKTDFVTSEEELIIRYKKQLDLYELAIKKDNTFNSSNFNIKKVIYSIHLNKIIEL